MLKVNKADNDFSTKSDQFFWIVDGLDLSTCLTSRNPLMILRAQIWIPESLFLCSKIC